MSDLEQLIHRYVSLGHKSSKGWQSVKCAVCNDYKNRGAFLFTSNDSISYNCFNCGFTTSFDPSVYQLPSDKFKSLLKAFGVSDDELVLTIGKGFVERLGQPLRPSEQQHQQWSPPKAISLPPDVHLITDNTSPWCEVARAYVAVERGLKPESYPFMVSDSPKLIGRLIIPFFHRDRLIYYQARSMEDVTITPRYSNPPAQDKDKLIFNYDELLDGSGPLYVVEGAFDALSIGPAIALSGSTMSEWKLQELKKAAQRGRKIIFVIDKDKNGYNLGLRMLKEGWSVAVMPDGVNDANHCRKKFGHFWLLNHLAATHATDIAGQVMLRMKCAQHHTKKL